MNQTYFFTMVVALGSFWGCGGTTVDVLSQLEGDAGNSVHNADGGTDSSVAPASCSKLAVTGVPLMAELQGVTPAYHQHEARLAYADRSGDLVALATTESPVAGSTDSSLRLRLFPFSPWGKWPTALTRHTIVKDSVLAGIGMSRSAETNAVSLVHVSASPSPDDGLGVFFSSGVSVEDGRALHPVERIDTAIDGSTNKILTVAASADASWHLIVWDLELAVGGAGTGERHSHIACVDKGTTGDSYCLAFESCGSRGLVADAVPLPDNRILLAYSTQPDTSACGSPDSAVQLPSQVRFVIVDANKNTTTELPHKIPGADDAVEFVELATHPDGVWVVYEYAGLNMGVRPDLYAFRMDETGTLLGPLFSVRKGTDFGARAATSMGRRLVVTSGQPAVASECGYHVNMFNEDGSKASSVKIHTNCPSETESTTSVLPSPSGEHVLVASMDQVEGRRTAHIARVSCVKE